MMKSKAVVVLMLFVVLFPYDLVAQQDHLYMPREIRRAYEKGTRSADGTPGKKYFQNRTDYTISVNFNPYTRLLQGSETIRFTNNSPDTLKRLVIRLNPNLLKKGAVRSVSIDPADVTDGVEITSLIIGRDAVDLENNPPFLSGKNMIVRLPKALVPSSVTEFRIDWNYIFQANSNIREGRYHETTYFIAYWFPRIAVYDDIYGWDRHNYNGEQEFYHEYGDYEVNITVPRNFYVWSSGILQNPGEVLPEDEFERFEASKSSDRVIPVLDKNDRKQQRGEQTKDKLSWRFMAEDLPDFAFALSDTYLWDASSVEVNGKRIHIQAVYHPEAKDFEEVVEISREVVSLLSDSVMHVDFPYPQMIVFNGHYGMEFPMMANDGEGKDRNETLFVTSHEIAHTYFPFLVGVNEQRYAWMDEGLITYLPKSIEDRLSHDKNRREFSSNIRSYSYYAGSRFDVPLMVPSDQLTGLSYMFASYSRSAVAFYVLEGILGKAMFTSCLQSFIIRWKGKHPTPYDFFYTVADVSGQSLNWFWEPWFFEFGYPDLQIDSATQDDNKIQVEVRKKGSLPVPVSLILTFESGRTVQLDESAGIWADGREKLSIFHETKQKLTKVEVDISRVPDSDRSNNIFLVKD
ncbi:MAG: M1 family metallopeptidase [bacterium]|jgi:hypothetical protein